MTGIFWHTLRRSNGTWLPFSSVKSQAGNHGQVRDVTCAVLGGLLGELHVCAITQDGRLWHTIRAQNGTWIPFGDVELQTGDRRAFLRVSAGAIGELHVAGVTTDGRVWHTVRQANGNWVPFGDVQTAAGERGLFAAVSISGIALPE